MAIGDMIPDADILPPPFAFVGCAGGSLCWSTKGSNAVLHLDESTGEFSDFTLPGDAAGIDRNMWYYNRRNLRVVGGDASTVHLVRIAGDSLEVLRYDCCSGGTCMVERRIRVPQMARIDESWQQWYFSDTADAAAPGHIVLRDRDVKGLVGVEYIWVFSVDIQNFKLERVQKLNRYGGRVFPYELPWTISACL
ncbi:unnamed protein product [Urochloa humidicola]